MHGLPGQFGTRGYKRHKSTDLAHSSHPDMLIDIKIGCKGRALMNPCRIHRHHCSPGRVLCREGEKIIFSRLMGDPEGHGCPVYSGIIIIITTIVAGARSVTAP